MHGNSRKFVLEVYPPPSAVLLPMTWACLLRHQHCSNLGQSVLVSAGFLARKAREQILTHKCYQQNTGFKRKIWSLASLRVFSELKITRLSRAFKRHKTWTTCITSLNGYKTVFRVILVIFVSFLFQKIGTKISAVFTKLGHSLTINFLWTFLKKALMCFWIYVQVLWV